MIRIDTFEKLSEDHEFNFGDRTKQKIYNTMKDWTETYYRTGEPFFTCLILKYYCKVSEVTLDDYESYLRSSQYYQGASIDGRVTVNVSYYRYFDKLRMFREFLERYEGEI